MKPFQALLALSLAITFSAQAEPAEQISYEADQVNGLIMADYEYFSLENNEAIDLLGVHYLHQITDWFFLGAGVHAPLLEGNYGGFMTYDATAQVKKRLWGNVYFDLGASLGGGGGGSSVVQSQVLSGSGGFSKTYAGLSYKFRHWLAGVGYSKFHFFGSVIDDSQLIVYAQKPVSFSVLRYFNGGKSNPFSFARRHNRPMSGPARTKVSVELNNIFQINPQGEYQDSINLVSFQFSQFLNDTVFGFIGGEAGIHGLRLYNQVLGGVGYQTDISDKLKLIGQLGVGSGGYAPSLIDTGSGLLVYPKLALEYPVSRDVGVALTGGYLFAPDGTSKNATVGLALNYYLAGGGSTARTGAPTSTRDSQQIRIHLYQTDKLKLKVNEEDHHDIHMVTTQVDYVLSRHWYLPMQVSLATNAYLDFPGYGEILLGLGVQTAASRNRRVQLFAQTVVGAKIGGIIAKPQVGLNYTLNDHFAVYSQVGISKSLGFVSDSSMQSLDVGLGLTYRFSLP